MQPLSDSPMESLQVDLYILFFSKRTSKRSVFFSVPLGGRGKGLAQSVERATPREEVMCLIAAAVAARSLLVGSVSV